MRTSTVLLLWPALIPALVLPRDEWDTKFDEWKVGKPQALVDAFSQAKGKFVQAADDANELGIFDDYEKPDQYVKVILSPGDSYTAGIGSNGKNDIYKDSGAVDEDHGCARYRRGWPEALRDLSRWKDQQGDGWRKNNFGACSGAVIQDIKAKQLELGENKDDDRYKKIGSYPNAPQLAVFTAGGNDLGFSDLVTACIYVASLGDCFKSIADADHRLNDATERQKLKNDFQLLYADIIVAGRLALSAGGPTKPGNFQLFHGTYIPFFDDEDTVCDLIHWSYFNIGEVHNLTTDLRGKLNKLTLDLNNIIREAAEEFKEYGVFWVDSYIEKFKEHRYCAPTGFGREEDAKYHSRKSQDMGQRTWFWSMKSKWRNDDEGPQDLELSIWDSPTAPDVGQISLDHLNISTTQQQQMADGKTPWDEISPVFKSIATFEKAMSDLEIKDDDGEVVIKWSDSWYRIFHPKGTALDVMAESFFDAIVEERDWTFYENNAPTTTVPQPTTAPQQPEQPPQPQTSESVQVFLAHTHDKNASGKGKKDTFNWHIFQGKPGETIDPCNNGVINAADDFTFYDFDANKDSNPGIFPNGEYQVKVDGQQCTYQGLGEERPDKDVGWLHCPDRPAVKCLKDPRFSDDYKTECDRSGIPQYYHAVAYCDW